MKTPDITYKDHGLFTAFYAETKEGEKYPQSHLQYDLIENKSEKNGKFHVSGVMSWEEKTTGDKISFFITKIA